MLTPAPRPHPFLISGALVQSTVLLDLTGKTREEVLRELVNAFPTERPDLREQLYAALLAREQLCSTAVDGGIAIPHSRLAIPGLVERPIVMFARHPAGVEFGAPDHLLTRLFFLLCADGIKLHLQMLSRLSRLLHVSSLRDELFNAKTEVEVLHAIRQEEALLD